jgi:hypothetical protein
MRAHTDNSEYQVRGDFLGELRIPAAVRLGGVSGTQSRCGADDTPESRIRLPGNSKPVRPMPKLAGYTFIDRLGTYNYRLNASLYATAK